MTTTARSLIDLYENRGTFRSVEKTGSTKPATPPPVKPAVQEDIGRPSILRMKAAQAAEEGSMDEGEDKSGKYNQIDIPEGATIEEKMSALKLQRQQRVESEDPDLGRRNTQKRERFNSIMKGEHVQHL